MSVQLSVSVPRTVPERITVGNETITVSNRSVDLNNNQALEAAGFLSNGELNTAAISTRAVTLNGACERQEEVSALKAEMTELATIFGFAGQLKEKSELGKRTGLIQFTIGKTAGKSFVESGSVLARIKAAMK